LATDQPFLSALFSSASVKVLEVSPLTLHRCYNYEHKSYFFSKWQQSVLIILNLAVVIIALNNWLGQIADGQT
jgi:hypothetical protein